MKCRKIQKKLPLLIRDDLRRKQKSRILLHVKSCAACQADIEKYRLSQNKMIGWMKEDVPRWEEGEWEAILNRAVESSGKKKYFLGLWPFWKGWALASMLVFAVLVSFFIIQPEPVRKFLGIESDQVAVIQKNYASLDEQFQKQKTVSMRMVSGESGLQIVWIFDKDFTWEEE